MQLLMRQEQQAPDPLQGQRPPTPSGSAGGIGTQKNLPGMQAMNDPERTRIMALASMLGGL